MSEADEDREFRIEAAAAVTRIVEKFPELESANLPLLRLLLEYAWSQGFAAYLEREGRRIEAELILKGYEQ